MGVLILGVGNVDRGDDAAGPLVARRLRGLGLDAREHSGEGLSLMESWTGAEDVIVIDAVVTGAPPGTISVWDARGVGVVRDAFRCSTHAFGVAEAVDLARTLGRLPGTLIIYGIEAQDFQPGHPASGAVLAAVKELTRRIACAKLSLCTNPD